jgi:hypothetical protein
MSLSVSSPSAVAGLLNACIMHRHGERLLRVVLADTQVELALVSAGLGTASFGRFCGSEAGVRGRGHSAENDAVVTDVHARPAMSF